MRAERPHAWHCLTKAAKAPNICNKSICKNFSIVFATIFIGRFSLAMLFGQKSAHVGFFTKIHTHIHTEGQPYIDLLFR